MNRTVNELILTAYKLSGEYADNEVPEGYRIEEALRFLNQRLDFYSRINTYISYTNKINFTMTPGKAEYEISRLTTADINADQIVSLHYVMLSYDESIFPIRILNDDSYYKRVRVNESKGFPSLVFLTTKNDKSIITFYQSPSFAYGCEIVCKQMLKNVTINQSLIELPDGYDELLEYELAKKLCFVNKQQWDPTMEQELVRVRNALMISNDTDLDINVSSVLMPNRSISDYSYNDL